MPPHLQRDGEELQEHRSRRGCRRRCGCDETSMDDEEKLAPIIVIKKKVGHAAHHGGAWKVAYADFVTAMMSLFIVLWLLNTSPQIKRAVAGYFNDPASSGHDSG